jgi:hypothetical protein
LPTMAFDAGHHRLRHPSVPRIDQAAGLSRPAQRTLPYWSFRRRRDARSRLRTYSFNVIPMIGGWVVATRIYRYWLNRSRFPNRRASPQ